MGGSNSREDQQVDRLMMRANPNLKEISRKLPDNKEIRVKKIYHVNKPEEPKPPAPLPVILEAPPPVVKVPVVIQEPPKKVVYIKQRQTPQLAVRTPIILETPRRTESQLRVIKVDPTEVADYSYNRGTGIGFENKPVRIQRL